MVKDINRIFYIFYLFSFLLFYYLSNFNIYVLSFGLLYLIILPFLLKYSKTNVIKIMYLLVIYEIFSMNTFTDFLGGLFVNYIFFYIFSFLLGYYLVERKLYLSKKSLYLLIFLLIFFISVYLMEALNTMITSDLDVTIPNIINMLFFISVKNYDLFHIIYQSSIFFFSILLFLVDYLNNNKDISLAKLNVINNYKKYIFSIIIVILIIQLVTAMLYINIPDWRRYPTISMIFITIIEIIIYLLIYKNIKKKQENFSTYFLLILIPLITLFGEFYFTFQDFYSFFLHTRILISFIMFFSGIHYNLYKKYPNPLKKSLGITIGILFFFQLVLGELLEAAIFGIPTNMDKFIIPLLYLPNIQLTLAITHGIVITLTILIFLYLHTIY